MIRFADETRATPLVITETAAGGIIAAAARVILCPWPCPAPSPAPPCPPFARPLQALKLHGLWEDFRQLAIPEALDDPPTAPPTNAAGQCWAWVTQLIARLLSRDLHLGMDLYFYGFFAQLTGFVFLMMSYFSIMGSTGDIVSSIRTNLLPGPLVLTQLALFALMIADRCVYLFKVRAPRALRPTPARAAAAARGPVSHCSVGERGGIGFGEGN